MDFDKKTSDEVISFIKERIPSIDDHILDGISTQKIDGSAFLQLTEKYLEKLFPLIGDRVKIETLISELKSQVCVTIYNCISYYHCDSSECTLSFLLIASTEFNEF